MDVELELDDEVILYLALKAHEKDVTLNQYLNEIIKKYVDEGEEK